MKPEKSGFESNETPLVFVVDDDVSVRESLHAPDHLAAPFGEVAKLDRDARVRTSSR